MVLKGDSAKYIFISFHLHFPLVLLAALSGNGVSPLAER